MTLKKQNRILLAFILLFTFLVLISAFIIEHALNHEPCKLCLYQRIPYFLSTILIILIFLVKKYEKITLLILSLIFFGSAILAFYHVGIEQGFFDESVICVAKNLSETLSKEELLDQLKQNTISCKNISFEIFGLSLATINTVFSLTLSVIFAKLFSNYE